MVALRKDGISKFCHDLNNPLAVVSGNLQSLAEYAADLRRVIEAYRKRIPTPDAEVRALERQIDLDFVLDDFGRAAKEALDAAGRIAKMVDGLHASTAA